MVLAEPGRDFINIIFSCEIFTFPGYTLQVSEYSCVFHGLLLTFFMGVAIARYIYTESIL